MRKPRAYCVNNKSYDLTGAAVYGDVVLLYEGQPANIFSTSSHAYAIKDKLKDAQSSDYLIAAGNVILMLLAFGILYEKFGHVNVLLFDTRTCTYTPRVIPKHQLTSTKEG